MFKKIVKTYRIDHWIYYLGFVLLGYFSSWIGIIDFLEIFKLILLASLLLAYSYSFNDFYDLGKKKKYFLFPFISSLFLLIFLNFSQILVALIYLAIVTFYSHPKTRFKAKPFISSLSNGIGFTLLFLLGSLSNHFIDMRTSLFFILFFSLNMSAQIIHETVHYGEDKKEKILTTIVFYGKKTAEGIYRFFLFLSALSCLILYFLNEVNLFFLISVMVFSTFFIFHRKKRIDLNLRKKYRNAGIITGIICLLSFLI